MDRIQLSEHFYLDEFMCRRAVPGYCRYCHGSVVIYPWFLAKLEEARTEAGVWFHISSGHRCLSYNRDVWAMMLYGRPFATCGQEQQQKVIQHDTSRHLWDAVDIRPVTVDKGRKERAYQIIHEVFNHPEVGYSYRNYDDDFAHGDTRYLTGIMLPQG